MIGKHLVYSTVFNNFDVLPIFPTDVLDCEGSNLACFQLPNNFTPKQYPIAGFEQE